VLIVIADDLSILNNLGPSRNQLQHCIAKWVRAGIDWASITCNCWIWTWGCRTGVRIESPRGK